MIESRFQRRRYRRYILIIITSLILPLAGCTNDLSAGSSPVAANGSGANETSPTIVINEEATGYMKISAQEAKQIIDESDSYILLDVRTEDEYSEQRIDGAILIPHTDINTKAPDELPDKDATILVYCRSGVRSAAASDALAQMGYVHVYDIGGIIDWPYGTVSGISEQDENSSIAKLLF